MRSNERQKNRRGRALPEAWVYALLALCVLAVYARVLGHDFINYDDPDYVTQNTVVQQGLTLHGIKWAFLNLHGEHTYWHPLTWISHMVDAQLFGLRPSLHHLGNVLFHAANSLLLLLFLRRVTGNFWRSVVVAALFAFHPLQVDTVAWITERKNVLSTLFWLLTLLAYWRYCLSPSWRSYTLVLIPYALGLMCKPALVTLPCVLLLLDFWPLRRFEWARQNLAAPTVDGGVSPPATVLPAGLGRLLIEKVPFFLMAAGVSAMIVAGHDQIGAQFDLPLGWRIANAIVSYVRYLGKIIWPENLAVFYPHPGQWPVWVVAISALGLTLLSAVALVRARRSPWLLVGWLWFLGTLVPMIGVVQAGVQAMADRFAYVPVIGIFWAVVWGAGEILWLQRRKVLASLSTVAVGACIALTLHQLAYWRDSLSLFQHAIAVTRDNYIAHYSVGNALADQGRNDEAMQHWETAVRMAPNLAELHGRIAAALAQQKDFRGAAQKYRDALKVDPRGTSVLNNLAWLLATCPDASVRNGDEAIRLAERACELTHYRRAIMIGTLAAAYAEAGRFAEAKKAAELASEVAEREAEPALAARNRELLQFYEKNQPYRDGAQSQ